MKKNTVPILTALLLGGILMSTACSSTKPAEFTGENETLKPLYELGLVGDGATLEPDRALTYAEAVMLAARAHAKLNSAEVPKSSGEWYESYLDYAKNNSLINELPDDPERPVLKYEVAELIAAAAELPTVNSIETIPDTAGTAYNDAVLELYNAGITLGVDGRGFFLPGSKLTAAEAAELYLRLVGEKEPLTGELDKISEDDAYALVINSGWNAAKEGIASGWTLDNRGGVPRKSLLNNYGSLSDISTTAETALIRHLNKTSTGILELYTKVSVNGNDGAYVEFRNEADDSVWQIMVKDNTWSYRNSDGSYTELIKLGSDKMFEIRARIDLDNCRTAIYINGNDCGIFNLNASGDDCNVYNLRFATTKLGITTIAPSAVQVTANYAVNENFTYLDNGHPFGWTFDRASISSSILSIPKNGSAARSFDPISGNAVAEFMYLYRKIDELSYSLNSGNEPIAVFTTGDEGFYVNGTNVYSPDYGNLWYRLRFEFDFDAQTVLVKVNGREVATVPLAAYTTSIDEIRINNNGRLTVSLDNFKVFRTIDHEDYVPEPVVPKDDDGYIVGMNVCSLWRNGGHYGWSCISPYDDPHPVLGYYDEGLPETADWEIKYLVEHGIDFQAFCIYMDSGNNAQRPATEHLYDGFMNAKYSNLAKFCVIWECQNAGSPNSMDEWKNNYVPYFIENYFKDPRHITIDNRVVLCVFGAGKLSSRLGGNANVKAAFDYLEEEIKKLGFDGMIYLACGSSSNGLKEMGFDGCYAYNWGNGGYQVSTNTSSIISSAKQGAVYTVPTISVGFNSIPWHGTRYPMMSMPDYAEAHEWVKTEYLPTYPTEAWQKNFVMLSTWNEYGEGTYIMPTTDEKGFGYIDTIRAAYTSEEVDESLNTIPTEEQLYRINHLYPQYLRLLRLNGEYREGVDYDKLETIYKIDLSTKHDGYLGNIGKSSYSSDGVTGTSSSSDPMIVLNTVEAIDLDEVDFIRIRAKLEKGSSMQMFFLTNTDKTWNETKGKTFTASSNNEFADYYVRASEIKSLTGQLAAFRVDPCSTTGSTFTVSSIEFLKEDTSALLSMLMYIDGNEFTQRLRPSYNEADQLCIAFDPSIGIDFALNSYHEWNKATKTLTLNFTEHTVVYRVGSDVCTIDGKDTTLSCKIGELDALPLIPITELCDVLGYEYSFENNVISIKTENYEYYKSLGERIPGQWEFNNEADTEGWSSISMQLTASGEYLACESMTDSTDPIITLSDPVNLDASKYKKLELRVRFKYAGTGQAISIYFTTDKESSMDEKKSLKINLTGTDSGDEWLTYTLDLTKQPQWNGIIKNLRFDPFNAVGHMDIDYIRFIAE